VLTVVNEIEVMPDERSADKGIVADAIREPRD
jgi:hypothetical protein